MFAEAAQTSDSSSLPAVFHKQKLDPKPWKPGLQSDVPFGQGG